MDTIDVNVRYMLYGLILSNDVDDIILFISILKDCIKPKSNTSFFKKILGLH